MSKVRRKITLKDIVLTDLPTRQKRVFIKIKNCVKSIITKPYPIIDNKCVFENPVKIKMDMPQNLSKAKKVQPLRLSFRLENLSGSGFHRYGIAKIDVVKAILSGHLQISMNLENCTEKPVLSMTLVLPSSLFSYMSKQIPHSASTMIPMQNVSMSFMSQKDQNNSLSQFLPQNGSVAKSWSTKPIASTSTQSNSLDSTATTKSIKSFPSNQSLSTTVHTQNENSVDLRPQNVSKERYFELESRIDQLLASIINEENLQ